MSILVTGATGLLGNNVVRLLLEKGETIRVLIPEHENQRPLEGLNLEILTGDIRDANRVQQACEGVDVVIHCAGMISFGWSRMQESHAINVDGTRHVAQSAGKFGARMIYVSSCDTLAPATVDSVANEETTGKKTQCTYVVTKTKAEQVVLDEIDQGLEAVIIHPAFMLGPWDWQPSSGRMLLDVARRFTPFSPRGGTSICDVRDVATAMIATINHWQTGRNYILAGHNMTFLDAWRLYADVTGCRPPRSKAPRLLAAFGGRVGDVWSKLSGVEPDVNSASVEISSLYHYYSSERAEEELGYTNRPARETIQAAWDWFKEYGYIKNGHRDSVNYVPTRP